MLCCKLRPPGYLGTWEMLIGQIWRVDEYDWSNMPKWNSGGRSYIKTLRRALAIVLLLLQDSSLMLRFLNPEEYTCPESFFVDKDPMAEGSWLSSAALRGSDLRENRRPWCMSVQIKPCKSKGRPKEQPKKTINAITATMAIALPRRDRFGRPNPTFEEERWRWSTRIAIVVATAYPIGSIQLFAQTRKTQPRTTKPKP